MQPDIFATPSGVYPKATVTSQPWKEWVKLAKPTQGRQELVLHLKECDADVGALGGY